MPAQTSGDVLISPRMDARVKDRSAVYKGRNQSPKFRDILRERCHSRIKASRRALLDEFRQKSNPDDLRSVLSSILHEEIRTLKEGPSSADSWDETLEIESSVSDSEDQWIISEYEKVLEDEEAALFREWENEVICPLCEKASLTETIDESVSCPKCQRRFPDRTSPAGLKDVLDQNILNHNLTCDEKSQFALISENDSLGLYQLCDSCGIFVHLL